MTTTSDQPLTRDEALRILRDHKAELAERFGVQELALFGSTVRNEAGPDSDVDILVRMDIAGDWKRSFDLQFFLEDLLQRPVDVVMRQSIFNKLRPYIEREAVDVFDLPENWRLPVAVPKRWDIYVDNMLEACRDVLDFTDGLDLDSFWEDRRTRLATLHALQTLGEAPRKIPLEVQTAHPEIPWRRIVDDRNTVAHEYYRVDPVEVWAMISDIVPTLIPLLEALRSEAEPEPLPDA